MRQLLVAAFVLACTHHAAALVAGPHSPAPAGMHPAGPHSPAPAGMHPGHLALRGGGRGKKEEAPASPDTPTLKPPGRIAHLFKKMVNDLFDAVDTNKDGKVDKRPIACARRAARACLPSI